MKNYVRRQLTAANLHKTFWGEILINADEQEQGTFNDEERDLAASWPTCACGRITADISRDLDDKPDDEGLASLGLQFYGAVDGNEVKKATDLMIQIEKRAQDIVRGKV